MLRYVTSAIRPERIAALLLLLTALCLSPGCGKRPSPPAQPEAILAHPEVILFEDDGELEPLLTAIDRQLHYLSRHDRDSTVLIGSTGYTMDWLVHSLRSLRDLLASTPNAAERDRLLRRDFTVHQATGRIGGPPGEMLVTGYYEPVMEGSSECTPPYIHPLYGRPEDLVETSGPTGQKVVGRIDSNGTFRPYWTRQEIEDGLLLRGHELACLEDPFDAFLFHVQGSGKIRLPDGTLRSLRYAGNNGHSYTSIGKLLVDEKKLSLAEADTEAIRAYLRTHPEEVRRILQHNRRFIFFSWAEENGAPRGSIGEILTPGRSVAIDRESLPLAALGYLVTQRPQVNAEGEIVGWTPLHRFVVPQDAGAAIKGAGRLDFFWGSDSYAATAAGAMREKGLLYFLVKKRGEQE